MRKRLTLILGGAAVLLLAVAAPSLLALVRSAAPDPYAAPVPYSWSLQLKKGPQKVEIDRSQFRRIEAAHDRMATIVVDENKPTTPDNATDDTTYTGMSLAQVVGIIDDKDPATFNRKLAMTGAGYGIEVTGIDYFSYVYSSKQVAELGKALLVADKANGKALVWGSVKVSGTTGTFKPNWPLKLVSSDTTITGKMKPSGILRISIVAAPVAPSPSPSPSPFRRLRRRRLRPRLPRPFEVTAGSSPSPSASPTPPPGGWTLTLQGKQTKVLPIAKVPATVAWHGEKAGNINPSLRYVYKGQSLYKLLALVDDAKPGSFNLARAKTGYTIQFFCRDGYQPKISSKLILRNGKPRVHWIVAKIKADKPLEGDEAPFRFVGGPPITQPFNNKLSAYGVIKIRLRF